jgi:hypothetical protein
MFGITVDMLESWWSTVIFQKLHPVAYVKSRWVTVVLIHPHWCQTYANFNLAILGLVVILGLFILSVYLVSQ